MLKFTDPAKQAVWDTLIVKNGHFFEPRIVINGVGYEKSDLISVRSQMRVFAEDEPSVGSCLAGELEVQLLAPSAEIPRMAPVEAFVRVSDGTTHSDWLPQGKYWIDTRETSKDEGLPVLSIHCFDAMLKTEQMFPGSEGAWPKTDLTVVNQIATAIGVSVDDRTDEVMTHAYSISAPVDYTMREVLSYIAGMYAGNWIMTMEGKLLLVTLNGIPEETSLLVDEEGSIITFGIDPDTGEELAISLVEPTV